MIEKKYSKDHEWIEVNSNVATVGITNHAQDSLGDIVYVGLPEIGKNVSAGEEVCVIESVKAASDIFSPIKGEIIEVNNILDNEGSLVNEDPENRGWIFKLKITDSSELDNLMTLAQYEDFIKKD
tara:strand:+ start:763 stop:1137 length:375 start_codon:yes stop_codon:yes gene_type:complete